MPLLRPAIALHSRCDCVSLRSPQPTGHDLLFKSDAHEALARYRQVMVSDEKPDQPLPGIAPEPGVPRQRTFKLSACPSRAKANRLFPPSR